MKDFSEMFDRLKRIMLRMIPIKAKFRRDDKGCLRSSEAILTCIVLALNKSKRFEILADYCAYLVLNNCNVNEVDSFYHE
jgi:hypothetical protein